MEKETTPIEKWIEKSRNKSWPKQKGLSVTACNRTMAKKVAYTKGCKELLSYLGLSDIPDPKLEIEALKQMQKNYADKTAKLIVAEEEKEKLKVEIAEKDLLIVSMKQLISEHELYHKTVDEQVLEKNAAIDGLMAEIQKMKEALGRIYTMDTSFENYINAIVVLKQIAGNAIK